MKIKSRPDYLFSDNLIVNIKDFDPNLLKIYKLSFRLSLVLIFTALNTSLQRIHPNRRSIDRTDNDEDCLYFFLDDEDRYIEENDWIKYLFSFGF